MGTRESGDEPYGRIASWLILPAAWLFAFLAAPDLGSGFRAEDFVAFDYYSRTSFVELFTRPHLDAAMVMFWRPLSDAVTWALVRLVGPDAASIHLLLLLLHGTTAAVFGWAAQRLFRTGVVVAAAVAVLAAVHPFAASVLLYMDGGVAQIAYGLGLGGSLLALGNWRQGKIRGSTLFVVVAVASVTFDVGMVLPVLLPALGFVLPPAVRRIPWWLLLWMPLLLGLRSMVMGVAVGGYNIPLSRSVVEHFPGNLAEVLQRLFLPLFADAIEGSMTDLHPRAWRTWMPLVFLPAALAFAGLALRRSPESRSQRFRVWLGAALVLGGLALPGVVDLLAHADGDSPLPVPVHSYRLYPGLLAAALVLALLVRSFSARRGGPGLLLLAPVMVAYVMLGAPFRAGNERAGEHCDAIRRQIAQIAEETGQTRFVLLDTPLAAHVGPRPLARVFQFGLSSAFRPPISARELFVYPAFAGMELLVETRTLRALLAESGLTALRYDVESRRVEREDPGPKRAAAPSLTLGPDGRVPPVTRLAADGSFELELRGDVPGIPQLFLLNRVHPFYVADKPPALLLQREPGNGGADRLRGRALQVLEAARRFPGDPVYFILESRSPAGTPAGGEPTVSNVFETRLRESGSE